MLVLMILDYLESQNIYISKVYTTDDKCPTDDSIDSFLELFDETFITELINLKSRDKIIKQITKNLIN